MYECKINLTKTKEDMNMTNRIHLARWNPDTNQTEWDDYSVNDIDFLMEKEVIDIDQLGFAMRDQDAFNKAIESLLDRSASYKEFVETYLSNTSKDIWIM